MKLVCENIFEFQKGRDPSEVLKLGKRKEMEEWLKKFLYTSAYKINSDFTVDIKSEFISPRDSYFQHIPEFIQFNECKGDFLIRDQYLSSMRGCPRIVHGDFMVDGNKITDLEGSPTRVDGSYYIKRNNKTFDVEQIKQICEVGGRIVT